MTDISTPQHSSEHDEVLVERCGAVAVIILNRPHRLNALTHGQMVELRRFLLRLDNDQRVRAIVLTGQGRAFSSGADLSAGPSNAKSVLRDYYNPLIRDMVGMATPIIAAVNGVAAGAGVSLTLACDLRVAAESASFRMSFVNVGLVPDAGATWLLPRAVGSTRAAEMVLLGKSVDAVAAERFGLVNEVVPDDEVRSRAVELATTIASLSSSVRSIRRLLHLSFTSDLYDQLDAEATAQGIAQQGPDFAEAKRAFAEKRQPKFI
ncbi:enoyl-CoA hydratase/isomerase family protein [Nocardia terrae]|nr:enoyl-CoA hydratase-related protein [Nocardia terrae]